MHDQDYREETEMDPRDRQYIPERDDSGRLIAELPTAELKRRLANLQGDTDWRARMFRRAYEAILRERGTRDD